MKQQRRVVGFGLWPCTVLMMLALSLAACGNDTGSGGEQTVDFDALDVDFDALDVDVNGIDIASYLDIQKQDTIGSEVNPPDADVQQDAPDVQKDVAPPECATATTCDDGVACTTDTCDGGKCVHTNSTAPCDDGTACTVGDACKDGACLPGEITNCNDENPCTDDSCDPAKGCQHTANTLPCSDGSACTVGDSCVSGACSPGTQIDCGDGNPCTDDLCDAIKGCFAFNNAQPCNDQDVCTSADLCTEGVCVGTKIDCEDGNPCTINACGAEGCYVVSSDVALECDDNNICTNNDFCVGATCTGVPIECPGNGTVCAAGACDLSVGCTLVALNGECNDGDPCTQVDNCKDFVCLGSAVTDCNDGNACNIDTCVTGLGCDNTGTANCDDGNSCTTDSCDMATGCTHTDLGGESLCDDGNACTDGTICLFGEGGIFCGMGSPTSCVDESTCTQDTCDPAIGCVFLPLQITCEDGNPCTTGDSCDAGYCVPGFATDCGDANPCTDDICQSGYVTESPPGCQHYPNGGPCDDGNPCTGGDFCSGSSCYGGEGSGCDDGNACTMDACSDASPSACTHTINPDITVCDDGNACTIGDACNTVTGACVGATPVKCSSDNPCLSDVCDPLAGCTYKPVCDDGDPCTTDECNAGACSHTDLAAFRESFAKGNVAGWTLGTEWQIGTAKASPVGDVAPGDPALGHNTSENEIAGVEIGGLAKRVLHDYYYLTSPVIDTTKLAAPTLEFWRWLDADTPPYMTDTVEVFDGSAWQTLWQTPTGEGATAPDDTAWTRLVYDLTAVSNAKLQFRFGFKIEDSGVYAVGSWNLDDIRVGEAGVCIPPYAVTAKPPIKPTAPKPPRQK